MTVHTPAMIAYEPLSLVRGKLLPGSHHSCPLLSCNSVCIL